jgi:phosphotransferase system enzyme I (PtsI)
MEDPYLRERENDVADVAGRLRMNLAPRRARSARAVEPDRRPVDPDRRRADRILAAQLDWSRVQGFATDAGSRTYHTAILARSLKVRRFVGLHGASLRVAAGTPLVLDGTTASSSSRRRRM